MIRIFQSSPHLFYVVESKNELDQNALEKLKWLFGNASPIEGTELSGNFIGPRKEMITPWSTNAVEITQNMGIDGVERIERFVVEDPEWKFDPMLEARYDTIGDSIFHIEHDPEPIREIDDISAYNQKEGLALNDEEIEYLNDVSEKLGRKLTDSEVFGFSQVNSEHCRHKIFNGTFILDGKEQDESLFQMIRKTSAMHPNKLVSAYKDNVAFIEGPEIEQFSPKSQDKADFFETRKIDSVLSLKAETHNFPTTVEPFNGAATGSGGEIRDRLAGGRASLPLAGTAVYITSYSRSEKNRTFEKNIKERDWLYQTPIEILIKASNGASDFGNKFGQPLITGSLLTFEHEEDSQTWGFDKVIMLAGGIGFANETSSQKGHPEIGDKIIVLGGDNYRIGMGGGSVSSVATGEYENAIELNAVQRSNPEMQKRVANAIRAMAESENNPIVSIHDHGAGGHLNCLSELVEESGGTISVSKLPIGDPTLSDREVIGNESQERMGLVMKESDLDSLKKVAERERAPFYEVGDVTGDHHFSFTGKNGHNPIDLPLAYLLGSSPKTVLKDHEVKALFSDATYDIANLKSYIADILQLEAVGCKDWLTNKVDRSVTGKVAKQQTCGPIQLPLNNLGVAALDYSGKSGVATSIGHAPIAALADPAAGSRLSIAESLTNLVWTPIKDGLSGVSLSANWMWPAKNEGEDFRLYGAVKAASDFAIDLGINIPTGKDSLSMVQKYPDGKIVKSPGTVIISAIGEVTDFTKTIEPSLKPVESSEILYIPFTTNSLELAGSAFFQSLNKVGSKTPDIDNSAYFASAFNAIQDLINSGLILSGHDVSTGGLLTALMEMTFPEIEIGIDIDLSGFEEKDLIKVLFAENPAVLIQVNNSDLDHVTKKLKENDLEFVTLGSVNNQRSLNLTGGINQEFDLDEMRDIWFRPSYQLEKHQTSESHAESRFVNYKKQSLSYHFPNNFNGSFNSYGINPERAEHTGYKAAIIREKGVNGDREMAYSMHLAGFDVKDVHMTDLISGREDLSDVNFIVFVGGFSNSDVLGSAKGWAGAFLFNEKAKAALDNFYARPDTLSLGVCNGCQLMMELDLLYPEMENHPKMKHNDSGKFESSFLQVQIGQNNSVMFDSLSETKLGVWVAHGEGKFDLEGPEDAYNIVGKYAFDQYPGNPNGSTFDAAIVVSKDGRHSAMMPHMERSIFPWQWAYYPSERNDQVSPWIEAFTNARNWLKANSL